MKKDFTFDTSMSREVLNNYLSRAVTHFGIGYVASSSTDTFEDDLRMFKNEGTKFIGRAAWVFSNGVPDSESFEFTKKRLARGHEVDPEFIFQACVFECICRPFVNQTPVPTYVFEAFGMPAEDRCFSFDRDLGHTKNAICGHCHENNASVVFEGVRYTHGLKTGQAANSFWTYDFDQNGGTVLLIGEEGVKDIYHEYIPFKHAFDREICHAKYRAPFDPEF